MQETFRHEYCISHNYEVNFDLVAKYEIFELICGKLSVSVQLESPNKNQDSVVPKSEQGCIEEKNEEEKVLVL